MNSIFKTFYSWMYTSKFPSDSTDINNFSWLEALIKDLEKWQGLYFTLAGRIHSVMMAVLPKFLCLFQSLPVFFPFNQSMYILLYLRKQDVLNPVQCILSQWMTNDRHLMAISLFTLVLLTWWSKMTYFLFILFQWNEYIIF